MSFGMIVANRVMQGDIAPTFSGNSREVTEQAVHESLPSRRFTRLNGGKIDLLSDKDQD
jgi:hypothetical protein